MNAVDRFSNTLARYRQMPQALPQQVPQQPAYGQPVAGQPIGTPVYMPQGYPQVQSVQAQPESRSDLDRTLEKVGQGAAVLSRLAALVQRVQSPPPAVNGAQAYPGTAPYVPPNGRLGQSLERLGQAVGDKNVDTFVRQAAPVVDQAIPLIEDIVNLASGKARPQPQAIQGYGYQPYGAVPQQPTIADQVAPIVDGVTSLASGVSSLVKAFEGLFKR